MSDTSAPSTVAVVVASSWASKINWTQFVGMAATVIALVSMNKISIPVDQQATIVAIIQGVQSLAGWIMRTWFTTTVTPASVANASTATMTTKSVVHIT